MAIEYLQAEIISKVENILVYPAPRTPALAFQCNLPGKSCDPGGDKTADGQYPGRLLFYSKEWKVLSIGIHKPRLSKPNSGLAACATVERIISKHAHNIGIMLPIRSKALIS